VLEPAAPVRPRSTPQRDAPNCRSISLSPSVSARPVSPSFPAGYAEFSASVILCDQVHAGSPISVPHMKELP
jgi:hypothetical protein